MRQHGRSAATQSCSEQQSFFPSAATSQGSEITSSQGSEGERETGRERKGDEVRRRSGGSAPSFNTAGPAASEWRRKEGSVRRVLTAATTTNRRLKMAADATRTHARAQPQVGLPCRRPGVAGAKMAGKPPSFLTSPPFPPQPSALLCEPRCHCFSGMPPGRKQARPGRTNPSAEPGPKEKRKPKSAREE